MNINDIKGIEYLSAALEPGKKINQSQEQAQGFGDVLKDALNKVNTAQLQAEQITHNFVVGGSNDVELHQVILATEKATLALQLTMQIRNKVIDAYQEIMRMQV